MASFVQIIFSKYVLSLVFLQANYFYRVLDRYSKEIILYDIRSIVIFTRTNKFMTHYFIKEGKNEIGPFTMEQLKYRHVSKDTPVWFAGLEEWTTAEQVYELKEIFLSKSSGKFSNSRLAKFWNTFFKKNNAKKIYRGILNKAS